MPSTATSILDGLSTSVAVKAPCRTVATSNITLSGLQTISGYTTVEDDRVLVKGQTDPVENGIYMASAGNWSRSKDADGARDLVQGTLVLVRSAVSDGNIWELTTANPIVIGTTVLTFELRDDPAITYLQTEAEIAAGATPVNYAFKPGHVYRYGTNTTPGTTDMTAAINTAADVCREGGYTLLLPEETCLFSSSLDFSGIHVKGPTGSTSVPQLQASSAQFNCILSTGLSYFEDFEIHGGWDGVTAGQSGNIFHFENIPDTYAYNIDIYNVKAVYAKRSTIRWRGAGYGSISVVRALAAGLHGIEIDEGAGFAATTIRINDSTIGAMPNGYGVQLTECVSVAIDGAIMEDTAGIKVLGVNNRCISVNNVYQENFTVASLNFFDITGTASLGITISNCFGVGRTITGLSGSSNVSLFGNAGIIEEAIPLAGRVITADSSDQVFSTTGGASFTVTSVVLPPGTWLINASLQTLQATATGMVGAACALTTNASASGRLITLQVDFAPGAAEAMYTPAGGQMDQRLNCFRLYQNTTGSDVTMYLRGWANFSGAGDLGYRGVITAMKLT
jgi:hypothetical protein